MGIAFQSLAPKLILIHSSSLDIIKSDEQNLVSCLCFELALIKRSQMLDRAFKQETSNIIEDTFSAYNICKGRMFEEINNATACALGSEKYVKKDLFL